MRQRSSKIISGALLVGALGACSQRVDVATDTSEIEANETLDVLARAGLEAQKRRGKGGTSVSVEAQDVGPALRAMTEAGLPRKPTSRFGDVFKKDSMVSTPLEERARFIFALSQELEHTLKQIDGVVVAKVHVVLPDRVAPGTPLIPSSAAVFIKHRRGVELESLTPRIQRLVARSVPGLTASPKDKVSVVFYESAEPQPIPQITRVGPVSVDRRSATELRWILAFALVAAAAGAAAIGAPLLLRIPAVAMQWALLKRSLQTLKFPKLRATKTPSA